MNKGSYLQMVKARWQESPLVCTTARCHTLPRKPCLSLKKSTLKTSGWALDDRKGECISCEQIRQAWEKGVQRWRFVTFGSGSTISCNSAIFYKEVEGGMTILLGCACVCTHRIEKGCRARVSWLFMFCTLVLLSFTGGWHLLL